MNTIPKWAIYLAVGLIAVAVGYIVLAARVRIDADRVRLAMDKKATELLEAQAKK